MELPSLILARAPQFLLVAVRVFAMIMTCPLLSMRNVPRVAKVALAGFVAFFILPSAYKNGWDKFTEITSAYSMEYFLFLIGEALIGVITGFYVSLIFAAFSSAGQFFSFQMGFSAAEAYDALSQIENPLMGQYLNMIAMLVFLSTDGLRQLFVLGVERSFQSMNCTLFLSGREHFAKFMLSGLSDLFFDAMMIALPMVGILFLISVTMGILSKAAPQMNLLAEGLPITILVSFLILMLLLPVMCGFFSRSIEIAFEKFQRLINAVSQAV